MTRSELRENVFQMLFRAEFHNDEDLAEQMELLCDGFYNLKEDDVKTTTLKSEEIEEIKNRTIAVVEKISEIDDKINSVSVGWKTSRMGKVDLTIIRLAVYEILFDEKIPNPVAINEAVELAKKFGTDDSSSFVNGVLGKVVA